MVGGSLAELPSFFAHLAYRCDPYLRVAAMLQAEGRKTACDALTLLAKDSTHGHKVLILCRMLFSARQGEEFRPPALGILKFFGETDSDDWPLEPIELLDGVPFLVYDAPYRTLAGLEESGEAYLQYCLSHCAWNTYLFGPKRTADKDQALAKLLRCGKWRRPLGGDEVERLAGQIQA